MTKLQKQFSALTAQKSKFRDRVVDIVDVDDAAGTGLMFGGQPVSRPPNVHPGGGVDMRHALGKGRELPQRLRDQDGTDGTDVAGPPRLSSDGPARKVGW